MSTSMQVRIVKLDPARTKRSSYGPDAPMRQYYFKLDGFPDHVWNAFFIDVNKHNFHMRKRRAWVESDYLVVDCMQDEIPEQLEILKPQIEEANRKYAVWQAAEEAEHDKRRQAYASEQESLAELAKKLNFD